MKGVRHMKNRIEQYLPITQIDKASARNPHGITENTNQIKLEVYYSLGGVNWMTGKSSPRGYYLSATPVEHRDAGGGCMLVGTILGSGIKDCLLEVSRQTDKQFAVACALASERVPDLLDWCRDEYGVTCEIPDEYFPGALKASVPKTAQAKPPRKAPPAVPVKPIRTQKLLTAEVIRKLEKHPFGSQNGKGDDAEVLVKFFGGGAETWLITEGEKQEDGDWLLYGKCTLGYEWEWGTVLYSKLENLKFPPFGLGVERDMYLASGIKVGDLAV